MDRVWCRELSSWGVSRLGKCQAKGVAATDSSNVETPSPTRGGDLILDPKPCPNLSSHRHRTRPERSTRSLWYLCPCPWPDWRAWKAVWRGPGLPKARVMRVPFLQCPFLQCHRQAGSCPTLPPFPHTLLNHREVVPCWLSVRCSPSKARQPSEVPSTPTRVAAEGPLTLSQQKDPRGITQAHHYEPFPSSIPPAPGRDPLPLPPTPPSAAHDDGSTPKYQEP